MERTVSLGTASGTIPTVDMCRGQPVSVIVPNSISQSSLPAKKRVIVVDNSDNCTTGGISYIGQSEQNCFSGAVPLSSSSAGNDTDNFSVSSQSCSDVFRSPLDGQQVSELVPAAPQILGLKPLSEHSSPVLLLSETSPSPPDPSSLSSLVATPLNQTRTSSNVRILPNFHPNQRVTPLPMLLSKSADVAIFHQPSIVQVIVMNNNCTTAANSNCRSVVNSAVTMPGLCPIAPAPSSPNVQEFAEMERICSSSRSRPHCCSYSSCNKTYFKSSHLKAHYRTHTGIKHLQGT